MRHTHYKLQNIARNSEKKYTLSDLEYGEKHSLMWKMRNAQCMTWSMVKKIKNLENETHTLQIIEYGEKQ